jgi:hypothetical protein
VDDGTPHRLAYEASVRAIDDQARVLEDLRSRAATLVAAAALVTGFLGEAVLTRADEIAAISWTGAAIGAFIVTAAAAFAILWPVHVRFSVSARDILGLVEQRAAAKRPIGAAEALSELALRLELMYDGNSRRVRQLLWVFRGAILFLSIEVAAWAVALWRL